MSVVRTIYHGGYEGLGGAWGDRSYHEHRLAQAVIGKTVALGPDLTFHSETTHG